MMMEVRCSLVPYQVSRLVSGSVGEQDLLDWCNNGKGVDPPVIMPKTEMTKVSIFQ